MQKLQNLQIHDLGWFDVLLPIEQWSNIILYWDLNPYAEFLLEFIRSRYLISQEKCVP